MRSPQFCKLFRIGVVMPYIRLVVKAAKKVRNTGKAAERVEPEKVRRALGAEKIADHRFRRYFHVV